MDAQEAVDPDSVRQAGPSLRLELGGKRTDFCPAPCAEEDDADDPEESLAADDTESLGVANIFTLGRDETNRLVCGRSHASRRHARIVYQNNDFYLIDQSTNGTFVQMEDERVTRVHRGKLRLWGSGWIALGEPLAEGRAIHFCLEAAS